MIKSHGCSQKGNEFYSEYQRWKAMKRRCYYKKDKHYKDYGARGITVCSSWLKSFENFLTDMGKCPDNHTLDRIDNEKNYNKNNCKWANHFEQSRNRRGVIWVFYMGKKITANELSKLNGIKRSTYSMRVSKYGWNPLDAATIKVGK